MKKLPSHYRSTRAAKVACTVSAAALMLGVSQATTVGLHFMENYCGSPTYSGYPVTMTAFGVQPNQWENLYAMGTGYGCPANGYTTNEVIDTTTSTDGLNPLPSGSLNVTWFGPTANFSGFGGYGAYFLFGAYEYDGQPPNPMPSGEFQIYSTFLRDGVNFGPGSDSTGDNNQPGWNVDITGLHTLFTNTPFVVELIAASDSIQYLTNAFIVDVTSSSTQSVTYPSTAFPVIRESASPWFRGHAGGLSTGSGAFNTDHIKMMSNRPQHGTDPAPNGYNLGGTISGFILTDKPVVTMSPQPVPVGGGDTVTWSAYAIGVPPLAYQWLKNGVPIPGATSLTYSLTNVGVGNLGNYSLRVTNLYGAATSSVVSVDHIVPARAGNVVIDANPKGPAHDGLNFLATWLATNTDGNGLTRTGVMSFNGTNNQITVPAFAAFNSPTGTFTFWLQTTQSLPNGTSPVILDRYSDIAGAGLRISLNNSGNLEISSSASGGSFPSAGVVNDGNWHFIALSYDQSGANGLNLYIDGALDPLSLPTTQPWSWATSQEIELGLSHNVITNGNGLGDNYMPFQGLMADFRMYVTNLTDTQIASIFSSNALADTNDLALQFNFTAAPSSGDVLTWQVPDGILQSAPTVNGPWTDVGVTQSKYVTVPKQAAQFYRYRGHTPVTQVSNPYLM